MLDVLEAECKQEDLLTLTLHVKALFGMNMRMFVTGPAIANLALVWLYKSEVEVQSWLREALEDARLGLILQQDATTRYHGSSWQVLFINGAQTHYLR